MAKKVRIIKNEDKCGCICPYCGVMQENCIQTDDYVEYPMLWCRTDGCNALCVLNGIPEKEKWMGYKVEHDMVLPLLFVERLCDINMMQHAVMFDHPLSDDEVNKILDTDFPLSDKNLYDVYPREIVMNFSVPVNSYNIARPVVPYHPKVDLSHDGCDVFVRVRKLNGESVILKYSDD